MEFTDIEKWSSRTLDRNISTQYYERLLLSQNTKPVVEEMKAKTENTRMNSRSSASIWASKSAKVPTVYLSKEEFEHLRKESNQTVTNANSNVLRSDSIPSENNLSDSSEKSSEAVVKSKKETSANDSENDIAYLTRMIVEKRTRKLVGLQTLTAISTKKKKQLPLVGLKVVLFRGSSRPFLLKSK